MAEQLRRLLIIGGTGTLGTAMLRLLLEKHPYHFDRIRVLSRNEHRQKWCERQFKPLAKQTGVDLDFFLGDIADKDRIMRAVRRCTDVFHFAAIKHVDKAEYNPTEAVRTNVLGTMNIIDACVEHEVHHAIFTSTDKAVSPFNTYGASKLLAENLWIAGNIGLPQTKFSAVRYGNVFGSQGSVIELWKNYQALQRKLPITHPEATRFFISIEDAAKLVYDAWITGDRAQVRIPKMKSTALLPLASLFGDDVEILGLRPGDKLHEFLISADEANQIYDCGSHYIKMPADHFYNVPLPENATRCAGAGYSSEHAPRFSREELKQMLADVGVTWSALGFTNSAQTI